MNRPEPDWWLGRLAAEIKYSLNEPAETGRARLRQALSDFCESPACDDWTRDWLGGNAHLPAAEMNDGYSLDADYRPCGNPECRTPIPRESRKRFCDAGCRRAAEEYEAEREPHGIDLYEEVPF